MKTILITLSLFLTQISFGQKNSVDSFLIQLTDSTKTFKYQMVEVGGIDKTGKEYRLKKEFKPHYNKTGGYSVFDGCNDCNGIYTINNNNFMVKSDIGVCTEAYCTPEFYMGLKIYDVPPSKMDNPYVSFKKIAPSYFEVREERLFFVSKFEGILSSGEIKITEQAIIYEKVKK